MTGLEVAGKMMTRRDLLGFIVLSGVLSRNQEEALLKELMRGYNKKIRPVEKEGDVTQVTLKLTLTNLISLAHMAVLYYKSVVVCMGKKEIKIKKSEKENWKAGRLETNVLSQKWCDYRLKWNSSLYDDFKLLRVPSKSIWLPDIVLENNVDGKFEITLYTNALVYSSGCIYWLPPAIYRSACSIKVTYFPFDWQNCSMVFRSQTYSANEIDLVLTTEDDQTIEWIVIDPEAFTGTVKATAHQQSSLINDRYLKDDLEYQEVVFFLIIQRKPLFYIINMIVPCVLISSLGLLAYYLPAKAGGQKCTVSISILLAQTVFLILISQKVPETSQAVPLIGKYLMFAMTVTTIIVMNCVIVLNVSLRTPNTHIMTNQVRQIFLNILPRFLRMHMRPWSPERDGAAPTPRRRSSLGFIAKADEYVLKSARTELMFRHQRDREGLMKAVLEKIRNGLEGGTAQDIDTSLAQASPEVRLCVEACNHIAASARESNDFQSENEEWFLVARVIDRVCFSVMSLLFILGTIGIFLMGHFNQAPSLPFPGDPRNYLP
nr:PREDICTED: acetylcholine receptor subunit gamma [Lepisosteus oculatus]